MNESYKINNAPSALTEMWWDLDPYYHEMVAKFTTILFRRQTGIDIFLTFGASGSLNCAFFQELFAVSTLRHFSLFATV